jgi:hypothetical protein
VLAGELRRAVDAERVGGIFLGVGSALLAVEHEVGRVVDQPCARGEGRFTQSCDGLAVDAIGALAVRLGTVHVGVGGCVDDHLRSCLSDRGGYRTLIAEIEILAAEGISREGGIIDMGITTGVLDKSGAWINYGKQRIGQGRENAKAFLREHADVAAEIEGKIRERTVAVGVESPDGEDG